MVLGVGFISAMVLYKKNSKSRLEQLELKLRRKSRPQSLSFWELPAKCLMWIFGTLLFWAVVSWIDGEVSHGLLDMHKAVPLSDSKQYYESSYIQTTMAIQQWNKYSGRIQYCCAALIAILLFRLKLTQVTFRKNKN